jgi:RHS repeat-associated protein
VAVPAGENSLAAQAAAGDNSSRGTGPGLPLRLGYGRPWCRGLTRDPGHITPAGWSTSRLRTPRPNWRPSGEVRSALPRTALRLGLSRPPSSSAWNPASNHQAGRENEPPRKASNGTYSSKRNPECLRFPLQDVTQGGTTTVTKYAQQVVGLAPGWQGLPQTWADLNGNNQVQTRRQYLDAVNAVFARIGADGTEAWSLPDHLGSVRGLMNNSSALIDTLNFDAWGNVTNESVPANGDCLKFAGGPWDANLNLYHFGARWEDPTNGHWTSQDPLGLGPDSNPNRYVRNSPTNATDPTGKFELPGWLQDFGGWIGDRAGDVADGVGKGADWAGDRISDVGEGLRIAVSWTGDRLWDTWRGLNTVGNGMVDVALEPFRMVTDVGQAAWYGVQDLLGNNPKEPSWQSWTARQQPRNPADIPAYFLAKAIRKHPGQFNRLRDL